VHPSVPAKNLKELIALARAKPGELSYASAGQGFPAHFAAELLKSTAKIDLLHVPYQGGGPSAVAVMGGHNPILFSTIPTVINHAAQGRLRIIAVTSAKRSPLLPDAPTIAESGLPGFDFTSVFGSFVRSATPKDAITRLSNEVLAALNQDNVRKTLMRDGSVPLPLGPVEFERLLHVKLEQIRKIVKEADIKLN
jgi:tripartite-type tricarboxylate transporter receptor subunit TctC